MKKIPFLAFNAVVIVAAIILITAGCQAVVLTSLIVGYVLGLAVGTTLICLNLDGGNSLQLGVIMIICMVIGGFWAYMAPHIFDEETLKTVLFLGPILGGLIGSFYQPEPPINKENSKS